MKMVPLSDVTDTVTQDFRGSLDVWASNQKNQNGPNAKKSANNAENSVTNLFWPEEGNVLLSEISHRNEVFHITKDTPEWMVIGPYFNITPNLKYLHPRYLYWFLQSQEFQKLKKQHSILNMFSNFPLSKLEKVKIPLPKSKADQERIVKVIDKADSISNKFQKALYLSYSFLESKFLEDFGDPAINQKSLPVQPLFKFASFMPGKTLTHFGPKGDGDIIELIRPDDIADYQHVLKPMNKDSIEIITDHDQICPSESIIMVSSGDPLDIGNVTLTNRPVAINQQITAIFPFEDVNLHFLYAQLLVGRRIIETHVPKTFPSKIASKTLQRIEFLCPDHSMQIQFSEAVRPLIKLNLALSTTATCVKELFRSICQSAFQGKI